MDIELPRRVKVTVACSNCRKKKVKCSGRPFCERCKETNNMCDFDAQVKKRGPQKTNYDIIRSKTNKMDLLTGRIQREYSTKNADGHSNLLGENLCHDITTKSSGNSRHMVSSKKYGRIDVASREGHSHPRVIKPRDLSASRFFPNDWCYAASVAHSVNPVVTDLTSQSMLPMFTRHNPFNSCPITDFDIQSVPSQLPDVIPSSSRTPSSFLCHDTDVERYHSSSPRITPITNLGVLENLSPTELFNASLLPLPSPSPCTDNWISSVPESLFPHISNQSLGSFLVLEQFQSDEHENRASSRNDLTFDSDAIAMSANESVSEY